MSDTPKMRAYIISLLFDGGPLCCSAVIAGTPELAVAVAAQNLIRDAKIDGQVIAVITETLSEEFLSSALKVVRGGEPGQVVSLVRPEVDQRLVDQATPPAAPSIDPQRPLGCSCLWYSGMLAAENPMCPIHTSPGAA